MNFFARVFVGAVIAACTCSLLVFAVELGGAGYHKTAAGMFGFILVMISGILCHLLDIRTSNERSLGYD